MESIIQNIPKTFEDWALLTFAFGIWLIITVMVAKPVLRWLLKQITAGISTKIADEQQVLDTLTAKTTQREGGFIATPPTFGILDDFEKVDGPVRQQFATGSFCSTQDWDYNHEE